MTYNPNGYKEAIRPSPGERLDATITQIDEGLMQAFIDPEVAKSWKNFKPDAKAIKVTATATNGFIFHKVITLPAKDDAVSPKSRFAKWKKAYGSYPAKDQKVWLIADGDGYYNFQA